MVWFSKEYLFCSHQKMWDSSKYIALHLWDKIKGDRPQELEIDRETFNKICKKIKNHVYDCSMFLKSIRDLEEKSQGLFVRTKTYGSSCFRFIVYPLSFLKKNGFQQSSRVPSANAVKPFYSEEQKKKELEQQQQFIDNADQLLQKINLKFDEGALKRIYKLSGKSIKRVIEAIEFLLFRNSTGESVIKNPCGYLLDALRFGWSDGFNACYQPEIPTFESRTQLVNFVDELTQKTFPKGIPIPLGT